MPPACQVAAACTQGSNHYQERPRWQNRANHIWKELKKSKGQSYRRCLWFCELTVWRPLFRYWNFKKKGWKSGKNMRFALYRWVKPNVTIPEQPKLLTLGHMLTRITERQGGLPTRNWRLVPLEIEAKNCARDKCSHNSSSGTTCIRARVASPELSNLSKLSVRMPPSGQIMIWRLDQCDSCWWWCPSKRCFCCCWSWFWGKRWHSFSDS